MPSSEPRTLVWSYLGRLDYRAAEELQKRLREEVRRSRTDDVLLLLEHPHVYTVGRNADRDDIVADDDWLSSHQTEVFTTDRGGKVTYHGPGQLVGYPILDLNPDRRDLRRYVRDLEKVLVRVLARYDIAAVAGRRSEEIGVWAGHRKIASIGVHVSRWITTHGFALNVSTDLSYFSGIVPCGLSGVEMTSIEALTGRRHDLTDVARLVAAEFAQVFTRRLSPVDAGSLTPAWPTVQ